jgi:putative flavoprotein involved in K+ transport
MQRYRLRSVRVVLIGAGAAGLGTAAELRRRGIPAVVLERGDDVAAAWRERYDSLRLHTVRSLSGLPRKPIPRDEGRWVSRNGVVRYLERYAAENALDIRTGTAVTRLGLANGGWRVSTTNGELAADAVVVATGYSNVPLLPEWPGRSTFAGELIHSADYRSAEAFRGRDVLVVGSGNSGAEIATNLADGGASRVRLSVRTPPQIARRDRAGIPAQVLGLALGRLPVRAGDAIGRALRKLTIPDLTELGLPRPEVGPASHFRATGHIPILDIGIVAAVRERRVEVVAGVDAFRPDGVVLSDGSVIHPDAVIAATGFRPGLEPLVGHLGVLDARGRPVAHNAQTNPRAPNLYFVGFRLFLGGTLWEAGRAARGVARVISRSSARGLPAALPQEP